MSTVKPYLLSADLVLFEEEEHLVPPSSKRRGEFRIQGVGSVGFTRFVNEKGFIDYHVEDFKRSSGFETLVIRAIEGEV